VIGGGEPALFTLKEVAFNMEIKLEQWVSAVSSAID
jgi:hypothetical protein